MLCAKLWRSIGIAVLLGSLTIGVLATTSTRASTEPAPTVDLSSEPAAWINSGPLTVAALDGKGAVLWFFEETCPTCRRKWPALLDFAKSHEGLPVVFIAVNSGTPRAEIEKYVKGCGIDWPVLLDESRQFEQQADVGQISLQNIHQVRVLTPEGRLLVARYNDLDGAVHMALQGAKWTIDPKEIPASLAPAWKAVALGNYSTAAAAVKKGCASTDPTTKEAAEKIEAIVQKKIAAAGERFQLALDSGDKYAAAQHLTEISKQFAGFDLPSEMTRQRQELARDPQVKAAIKAAKDIQTAQRMLAAAGANPATRNRAQTMLKQAAKDAAGTEVGKQAEEMLAQLGSP